MLWTLQELMEVATSCHTNIGDKWVPARPINWRHDPWGRVRAAWMVLTGRADAVVWPEGQ